MTHPLQDTRKQLFSDNGLPIVAAMLYPNEKERAARKQIIERLPVWRDFSMKGVPTLDGQGIWPYIRYKYSKSYAYATAAERGSTAGHILLMLIYQCWIQERQDGLSRAQFALGCAFGVNKTYMRECWDTYKSVSHIWAAWLYYEDCLSWDWEKILGTAARLAELAPDNPPNNPRKQFIIPSFIRPSKLGTQEILDSAIPCGALKEYLLRYKKPR